MLQGFETEKFHKKGTPILLLALFCVVDAFVYVDIIYKNPYVHDVDVGEGHTMARFFKMAFKTPFNIT